MRTNEIQEVWKRFILGNHDGDDTQKLITNMHIRTFAYVLGKVKGNLNKEKIKKITYDKVTKFVLEEVKTTQTRFLAQQWDNSVDYMCTTLFWLAINNGETKKTHKKTIVASQQGEHNDDMFSIISSSEENDKMKIEKKTEQKRVIHFIAEKLDNKLCKIFELVYEGKTQEYIAYKLNIPLGTCRSQYLLMKRKCWEIVEENNLDPNTLAYLLPEGTFIKKELAQILA